jgi:hypothetical protein
MERSVSAIGDRPYAIVGALYLAAVLIGWQWRWSDKPLDRHYIAAGELVNNHRIVLRDLKTPDTFAGSFYLPPKTELVGRYIRAASPIRAKQPIPEDALADKPDMQLPDKSQVAFPLPAAAIPLSMLDAGSTVILLGKDADGKNPISITATVHAIVCDAKKPDGETCFPVLRIPAKQSDQATSNQATLRVVLPP